AIAGLERLTAVKEDGRRRFIVLEISVGSGEERDVALIERETTFGEADRRRDQRTARARAVFFTRVFETRHGTGHPDRQMPLGAGAFYDIPRGVQINIACSGKRRLFAEVEEGLATVGELNGHETAAAQISRGRIDHCHRVTYGDRR